MTNIETSAKEIANVIDSLPNEQIITDLIVGAAERNEIGYYDMHKAVTRAYHPIYQANQKNVEEPYMGSSNIN